MGTPLSSNRRPALAGPAKVANAVLLPQELAGRIQVIRGQRVLLDADLARLYEVETKRFNEQIRRNPARFPPDFMFSLTPQEFAGLRSQIATSNRGGRRYLPMVFTEHGAIMAASVLNSERAVEMSVFVVRAFVQLREALMRDNALADKLAALEKRVTQHDQSLSDLIEAIRALMAQPKSANRPIGFTADLGLKNVQKAEQIEAPGKPVKPAKR
jgi:ORF6N domain